MFFSNNSSNSKNLIWLLKSQAEPLFRLNYFQFERDCKGKKHFLISKHLSVFFNFHLGKNSLLNYRWFRLAGANIQTFSSKFQTILELIFEVFFVNSLTDYSTNDYRIKKVATTLTLFTKDHERLPNTPPHFCHDTSTLLIQVSLKRVQNPA